MSQAVVRTTIVAWTVLLASGASDAAPAQVAKATLVASVKVVASCQITAVAPLTFPSIDNVGLAQTSYGEGSMTYACKGIAPKLSASDGTSTTTSFSLKHGTGVVPFTLCALDQQYASACTALENDNKTAVAVADAGTEYVRGEIVRAANQHFATGTYTDDVVVTLTF